MLRTIDRIIGKLTLLRVKKHIDEVILKNEEVAFEEMKQQWEQAGASDKEKILDSIQKIIDEQNRKRQHEDRDNADFIRNQMRHTPYDRGFRIEHLPKD